MQIASWKAAGLEFEASPNLESLKCPRVGGTATVSISAMVATVGDAPSADDWRSLFANARDYAEWNRPRDDKGGDASLELARVVRGLAGTCPLQEYVEAVQAKTIESGVLTLPIRLGDP
jgi:hypothetical protein